VRRIETEPEPPANIASTFAVLKLRAAARFAAVSPA